VFLSVVEKILSPDMSPSKSPVRDWDFMREAEGKLESKTIHIPADLNTIYRASGITRLCPREEVLRHFHQVIRTEVIPAKTQITFDFGNAFNDLVQNRWFGKWGWLVGDWISPCGKEYFNCKKPAKCDQCNSDVFTYRELSVENRELGLSGHTDGIIENDLARKLVELKTCNSRNFIYITQTLNKPLPQHVDQIQVYFYLFKVFSGAIVYLNKDDSNWVQFSQTYNESMVKRLLEKPKAIRRGIATKVVPKREICDDKDCSRAKACPVKKICFEL
jgi:hypothetical protein